MSALGFPIDDPVCLQVDGSDLCGGGDLPREARRTEPNEPTEPEQDWNPRALSPAARAIQRLAEGRYGDYSRTNPYWEALAAAALETVGVTEPGHRTLSDLALELVNGPRQDAYAPPAENMTRIGSTWGAMLGLEKPIPGWRVALMLAALKLVRASHRPGDDSLIDAVGYVEISRQLRPDPSLSWHDQGFVGAHKDRVVSNGRQA